MKHLYLYLSYALILLVGMSLRLYHWDHYPFGFDQVQILDHAEKIAQGDLILLGPRTGPIEFFTGPLIYYLTALFWLVTPTVYSLWITTTVITFGTGIIVAGLTQRYLASRWSLVYVFIWAVSPYLVALDRTAWNPNLSFLAGSLVFFPLLKPALGIGDSVLIATGIFLGYQAHFSGLVLIGLYMLAWFWKFRNAWVSLILAWLGFALSLLPTILFDLTHGYLNYSGLLALLDQRSVGTDTGWIGSLIDSLWVSLENIGKVLLWGNTDRLIILTGLGLAVLGFSYRVRKHDHQQDLAWGWIVVIALVFSLYTNTKPEYYFLMQLPAIVYLLSAYGHRLSPRLQLSCLGLLTAYSLWTTHQVIAADRGLNLRNQQRVQTFVKQTLAAEPIVEVVYDMKPHERLGMEYLLKTVVFAKTGSRIHVNFPYMPGNKVANRMSAVGGWIDRRQSPQRYLETASYILQMPPQIEIFEDVSLTQELSAQAAYLIWDHGERKGHLVIFDRHTFAAVEPELHAVFTHTDPDWQSIEIRKKLGFGGFYQDRVIMALPLSGEPIETVQGYLAQISFLEVD